MGVFNIDGKNLADKFLTEYTSAECITAFLEAVNKKAASIGMANTTFNSPAGMGDNPTTARDLMRMFVCACGYDQLLPIWAVQNYTVYTKAGRKLYGLNGTSKAMVGTHPWHGGKTGTWGAAVNLGCITSDGNGGWLCGVVTKCTGDRFTAMAALFDIADKALNGEDVSSESVTDATSAIVCKVPEHPGGYMAAHSLEVLFEQNADSSINTASTAKVMTAITALDFIPDIFDTMTVADSDLNGIATEAHLQVGDVLTFRDILYCMMLPSDNAAATAMGRTIGGKILNQNIKY